MILDPPGFGRHFKYIPIERDWIVVTGKWTVAAEQTQLSFNIVFL
jgi:hypothetical protein